MERTRIPVGDCRCAGSPHPEDWVEMYPTVPIAMGFAVMGLVRGQLTEGRLVPLMGQCFVRYGIKAWSFLDADGDPIGVDNTAPDWDELLERLLPWDNGGMEVAEAGDALYAAGILRPLQGRTSKSSQAGPMEGSTSPAPQSLQPRRKRSRPSSRSGSDGRPSGAPVL